MYDLLFVRRRRRRKIAALVSAFSAIGVTSLVIISFLGRTVGTFTVTVQNTTVKLALSEEKSFKNPTSYLRIDELPSNYYLYAYDWFFPNVEVLDNENYDYLYGASIDADNSVKGMQFLKYTFYVKNVGSTPAKYSININLDECTKPDDGTNRTLDETLRIMVFENEVTDNADTHDFEVYAKDAVESDGAYKFDKEGNQTYQEFISSRPYKTNNNALVEDDDHPLAKSFLSFGKTVIKKSVSDFGKGDMMRYTLVYWLEGEDPQAAYNETINEPKGATIKMSVDITATNN